jgi:hypothetical protein
MSKHFAAPVWCRPGLLWRVRFAIPTQLLSPSGHHKVLVFVHRAGPFRAAFIIVDLLLLCLLMLGTPSTDSTSSLRKSA